MEYKMFPCTMCGVCCQNISEIEELKEYDLGNGVCKYYDEISRECKIYDNRPDICNIEKMYESVYSKNYTKEKFYRLNAQVCNLLQEKFGIIEDYRVKIN